MCYSCVRAAERCRTRTATAWGGCVKVEVCRAVLARVRAIKRVVRKLWALGLHHVLPCKATLQHSCLRGCLFSHMGDRHLADSVAKAGKLPL